MNVIRQHSSLLARSHLDGRFQARRWKNKKDPLTHWIRFDRWQDRVDKVEKEEKKKQLLRRWLPMDDTRFRPIFITPEREQDVLPQKPIDEQTREERGALGWDGHTRLTMLRYIDLSPNHMRRFQRYQTLLALQYDQRYIPERHLFMGADLASAHFIVSRGGLVKFANEDEWHKMDEDENYVLPSKRVDDMYLEAIDASNTELMFEGFGNLIKLHHLRFLSIANCEYMTDWCLSRMHQFENSLEFLDLSNCVRLSANAISSLARLKKLKYLRLQGLDHISDIAKAALMLENNVPGLTVVGLDYKKAVEGADKTDKLLSHPACRQDARGNIFLKDELGDFYYLKGSLPERPVVDEENLPLIISKIRKDVPAVPYEVAETVNQLSDGKLKHLLAGNVSGEWSRETERILKFDTIRKLKNGEFVDPFLYPDSMKDKAIEALKQKTDSENKALNLPPETLLLGTTG